jgi:glyoxylase-like metal-dependent hydrolase (beta-lactamase superfamily II)
VTGADAPSGAQPAPHLGPPGAEQAREAPPSGSSPKQERLDASTEVEEVAPGVLRAQLPIMLPGLGHVNCYVLEDDRGVTLVDPGLPDPETHQQLIRRLAQAGIPLEAVHTVLVTHSHPDHFGGAGRLKVEHHCEVVAHESFVTPFDPQPVDLGLTELDPAVDADLLEAFEEVEVTGVDGPVNRRLAGVLFGEGPLPDIPPRPTPYGEDGFRPTESELEWMRSWDDASKKGLLSLTPTTRVRDEQRVRLGGRDWEMIHTPGHTGDHLCLFDPESGTLLSGDHVLPTITPHISGLTPAEDALADFVAGLRRVAALEGVTTVLPAHGLPFSDLQGRVDDIIRHHDERLARLSEIGSALGTARVPAYSQELFAPRSWGPMAESETYAHLEHLRLLGRMTTRRDERGRLLYTPVS